MGPGGGGPPGASSQLHAPHGLARARHTIGSSNPSKLTHMLEHVLRIDCTLRAQYHMRACLGGGLVLSCMRGWLRGWLPLVHAWLYQCFPSLSLCPVFSPLVPFYGVGQGLLIFSIIVSTL